ncbi:adenosine deaminase [Mycobacterium attenuatum]|uniref:adenosine deaminase n=1 Tax=Mycobacterium attenuatum TaxID=2341086 RepID=UPI000F0130A5|nr:adenosine deaminase [Mycobacterium attenuatum]VBA58618.1 Adenosine deaminase [Mycobacterium attenuatum]
MEKPRKRVLATAWRLVLVAALTVSAAPVGWANGHGSKAADGPATAQARTAGAFEAVRGDPAGLAAFLHAMPKGGDIHNHPSGAEHTERFIKYAAEEGLCVVVSTLTLVAPEPPCDAATGRPAAANALADQSLRERLIDAWSMRNSDPSRSSAHDHFFSTFGRFAEAWRRRYVDVLADVISQAAAENVSYLELMYGGGDDLASMLGAQVGWDHDLGRLRARLLAAGLGEAVAIARRDLDVTETAVRQRLRCGTSAADPGCAVTVRYLHAVNRMLAPERVFAQFVTGYELVRADPRVVGVNLYGIEDSSVARRDYRLQMAMLDYLHDVAPDVPTALHAGELAPGLVPPEELRFHIRAAVEQGHAHRIGHGVDLMYEDDPLGLLAEMAERKVAVVNLFVSNAQILDVSGPKHPFPIYWTADVPVALATDDEGVSGSTMAAQYQYAVEAYGFDYASLKQLVRQSLEYSFLPGASLWAQLPYALPVAVCADDLLGGAAPSSACGAYLQANERAREQWRLEGALAAFERRY